jgi:hypothetical protein
MTCQTNNCTVFGCAMCPVSVWCVCGRNAAAPVPLTSRSLVLLELLNAALAAGCISPLMTWSRGGGTWNCHWNASSSSSSQPLGIPNAFLLGGAFSLGRAFSLGVGLHVACLGFCSLALEVEVGLVRVRERVRVRVRVAVRARSGSGSGSGPGSRLGLDGGGGLVLGGGLGLVLGAGLGLVLGAGLGLVLGKRLEGGVHPVRDLQCATPDCDLERLILHLGAQTDLQGWPIQRMKGPRQFALSIRTPEYHHLFHRLAIVVGAPQRLWSTNERDRGCAHDGQ